MSKQWGNKLVNILASKENTHISFKAREFSSSMIGTLASGTNLGIGNYKYKVAYVNSEGESNPSQSTSVITSENNQTVKLSNIPLGPTDTLARKIYRTEVDGAIFKVLNSISDNTTTTFTDTILDSSLGIDLIETIPSGKRVLEIQHQSGESTVILYKKDESNKPWVSQDRIFVGGWMKESNGIGLFVRMVTGTNPGSQSYHIVRESSVWKLKKGNFPGYSSGTSSVLTTFTPNIPASDGWRNLGLAVETDSNSLVRIAVFETNISDTKSFFDYSWIKTYEDTSLPFLSSFGSGAVSSVGTTVSHFFDNILWTENFHIR